MKVYIVQKTAENQLIKSNVGRRIQRSCVSRLSGILSVELRHGICVYAPVVLEIAISISFVFIKGRGRKLPRQFDTTIAWGDSSGGFFISQLCHVNGGRRAATNVLLEEWAWKKWCMACWAIVSWMVTKRLLLRTPVAWNQWSCY